MRTYLVLLQCPVVDSISDGGQSCVRGIGVSALWSEFCTVQLLEVYQKSYLLYGITMCPHLGVFLSVELTALQP